MNTKINPVLIGILVGILFTSSLFAAYYYGFSKNQPIATIPTPSPTISTKPTQTPITPTSTNDGEYGKLTWLSSPQKVSNPDILKISNPNTFESYLVGKFSTGAELILCNISAEGGMGGGNFYRIIKQNNHYYLIETLVTDQYVRNDLSNLFDKTKITFISYDTLKLTPPVTLIDTSREQSILTRNQYGFGNASFFSELKNPKKVASSEYGDIYAEYGTYNQVNSDINSRTLYLKLPDTILISYNFHPGYTSTDDSVPAVFLRGSLNTDRYEPGIPMGCGLGGSITILKNGSALLNGKEEVGYRDSLDNKIYQVKSAQSELVKFLYKSYKTGRDYQGAPPILSLDEFASSPNHFLFQEKQTGDWRIFVNSKYAPNVECGKPVVYLYPQTDTQVTVKVGANITKSAPTYPQAGWTVLAHPNGQLDYQNQTYPNLFWEGKGYGSYPNLSQKGFVIPQKDLVATIKKHLSLQGLNQTEINDFMDFWQSKLPTTPYTRVTWLTTSEMNQLAPLSVSPKPNTVIRVFMDFEGLDQPVKLQPQNLTSIPRDGFTLVEWGGLLFN